MTKITRFVIGVWQRLTDILMFWTVEVKRVIIATLSSSFGGADSSGLNLREFLASAKMVSV
jgi:hypothetical protein